jgi:hypothetical protein
MSTIEAPPSLGSREHIILEFDCRKTGTYVSAECQLDSHHGCPGGIRDEAGARALICVCSDGEHPTCSCTPAARKARR